MASVVVALSIAVLSRPATRFESVASEAMVMVRAVAVP
jgi:hypothetical protein